MKRRRGDLVRLVHVATTCARILVWEYLPGEQPEYDVEVLEALRIDQGRLEVLRERLAADVVDEIREMVDQCM